MLETPLPPSACTSGAAGAVPAGSLWPDPTLPDVFAPGTPAQGVPEEPLLCWGARGPLSDHTAGGSERTPNGTPCVPRSRGRCRSQRRHAGEERNFCVNPIYCQVSHFPSGRQPRRSAQRCMKGLFNIFLEEGEEKKETLSEKSLFQLIMK